MKPITIKGVEREVDAPCEVPLPWVLRDDLSPPEQHPRPRAPACEAASA
ncbi:MAG: hypothetical protein IT380_16925 [Myxococcales bacterium]|nr:hypothetical protein [Myxococcales bacterium]